MTLRIRYEMLLDQQQTNNNPLQQYQLMNVNNAIQNAVNVNAINAVQQQQQQYGNTTVLSPTSATAAPVPSARPAPVGQGSLP